MSDFQLVTRFEPAGDQPEAIRQMVEGIEAGLSHQTLLGVTGSGKTFSIANVIAQMQPPDPGAGAEQDPGRAALWRVQGVLPEQRGGVLRFLLRLLPARSLCAVLRHLHREGCLDQRPHRADASVGDQGAAGAQGRDHRHHGVVHLRPGQPGNLSEDGAARRPWRQTRPARTAASPGRACNTPATTWTSPAPPSACAAM